MNSTERGRLYDQKYPMMRAYRNLGISAARRNISFELTLDEFEDFCHRERYLELKGRGAGFATVDRRRSELGYTYDNIQVREYCDNCGRLDTVWTPLPGFDGF